MTAASAFKVSEVYKRLQTFFEKNEGKNTSNKKLVFNHKIDQNNG